jgi:hypothetical protein
MVTAPDKVRCIYLLYKPFGKKNPGLVSIQPAKNNKNAG